MIKLYYLTITPFFPTINDFRGPFIYDQVKAIQEKGQFELMIFKPKSWYSKEEDYEFEGMKVFRFKKFELPSNILPGLFDFLSVWSFKRKLKSLGIEINSISVAHSHVTGLGIFANSLKRVNPKIKTVLQHHGFDVLSLENGRLRKLECHRTWVKNYGIKICNAIDVHVGVSNKTLNLLEQYNQITIKEMYTLYNGVDKNKFYPIQGYKNHNFFTIGCIANFWPLKDQITLLKATQILVKQGVTNLFVKLVGSGETLTLCKDFVQENELGNFVEFIDSIPHNQLVHFYNSLDLFVLPSYYEAFGCVYLEAHACGVPFIAVEGQGIAELLLETDKENWLIKKNNDIELSEKIFFNKKNKPKQWLINDYNINNYVSQFLKAINLF